MKPIPLVLLPGLDGTGKLFEPLLKIIPSHYEPLVISYSADRYLNYADLLKEVENKFPSQHFVLLAESYSGPPAVEWAARHPAHLQALILCASFVKSPIRPFWNWLVRKGSRFLFSTPPPDFLVRRFLLGKEASPQLVELFREALALVKPEIIASRIRDVLKVDAREALKSCKVPLLYLAAEQDKLVSPRNLREMKTLQPDLQEYFLEGPHLILQRAPKLAFKLIDDFLQRVMK